MTTTQKFLFDTSFDPPEETARPATAAAPRQPPEPTFSRAELDAARDAGIAEGRAGAFAEAADGTEQRAVTALGLIGAEVQQLAGERATLTAEVQRDALALVRIIVRKLAPALCRKNPLAEIDALVAEILRDAIDEPRLVVRVADDLFDAVQARLAPLAEAAGFAGKLVLLADGALMPGDCRIEWADGGTERNTRRLLAEIDTALARLDPASSHETALGSGDQS
jgi:flagellar assembly protein FliH